MRFVFCASALVALSACVSQITNVPRKDRPLVVRVGPNGFELVAEDGVANRRECSIEEIVGSHIPVMICSTQEQRDNERLATQNDFFMPRNCRDAVKCDGAPRGPSTGTK